MLWSQRSDDVVSSLADSFQVAPEHALVLRPSSNVAKRVRAGVDPEGVQDDERRCLGHCLCIVPICVGAVLGDVVGGFVSQGLGSVVAACYPSLYLMDFVTG